MSSDLLSNAKKNKPFKALIVVPVFMFLFFAFYLRFIHMTTIIERFAFKLATRDLRTLDVVTDRRPVIPAVIPADFYIFIILKIKTEK